MKRIRDAQTILGSLEDGKAIQALSRELIETLSYLKEHSADRPKAKTKGSVTLKLDITVENGTAVIAVDLSSKRRKEDRGTSFYWLLEDGSLTTEHPQQQNMFDGLREVKTDNVTINGVEIR